MVESHMQSKQSCFSRQSYITTALVRRLATYVPQNVLTKLRLDLSCQDFPDTLQQERGGYHGPHGGLPGRLGDSSSFLCSLCQVRQETLNKR